LCCTPANAAGVAPLFTYYNVLPLNLGIHLAPLGGGSTEQADINVWKMGGSDWGAGGGTYCSNPANQCFKVPSILNLDSQGYPMTMQGVGAAAGSTFSEICSLTLGGFTFPAGNWLIKYNGNGINPIADAGTIVLATAIGQTSVGTITDNTPGRLVVNIASPITADSNGLHFCITATGGVEAGNYIKNIAIIYCGASAAAPSTCSTGYEALWNANNRAINPAWYSGFGTTHTVNGITGPGFNTYRYVTWTNSVNPTLATTWANRTVQGAYTYGAASFSQGGVAWEDIADFGNQTCANYWIDVPPPYLSVVNDATATASLSGTTLTVSGVTGTIQTNDYIWSPFFANASISGNQLTVTSMKPINGVTTFLAVGATVFNGAAGLNVPTGYTIIAGPNTGGAGTYTLSGSGGSGSGTIYGNNFSFGAYVNSPSGSTWQVNLPTGAQPISATVAANPVIFTRINSADVQSLATLLQADISWCNAQQIMYVDDGDELWNFGETGFNLLENFAYALWGIGGNPGTYAAMGTQQAIISSIFKTTIPSSRIRSVLGGQNAAGPPAGTQDNSLFTTPFYINAPAWSIPGAFDYFAIAQYWTFNITTASYYIPATDWLANSDGGNAAVVAEALGTSTVQNIAGGMTQSGGTLYGACTRVPCTFIPTTTTSGTGTGALVSCSESAGALTCALDNGGENYEIGSIIAITNGNAYFGSTGSGWSGTITSLLSDDTYAINSFPPIVSAIKSNLASFGNLPIIQYETGEQWFGQNDPNDPNVTLMCNFDNMSGANVVTTALLNGFRNSAGNGVQMYYYDIQLCEYNTSFGLKYSPGAAPTQKYNAAITELQ